MEPNQPDTAPPSRRSIYVLCLLLLVTALGMWAVPDAPAPHQGIPEVDPSFFNTAPIRKLSDSLVTADDGEKCTECHDLGDKLDDITPGELGNHEKQLKHGRNNKCFHCHNPKNMDTFQDRDGNPVEYKDVVQMCTNCHGPQYRDWKAGIHGRRLGYFDLKKGEQRSLRCIECHDPHYPVFKPLKPAPGPHVLHQRYTPPEPPSATPASASTPGGSATPGSSATPTAPSGTPDEATASPAEQKKGDTP